jgi:hypothetical protein
MSGGSVFLIVFFVLLSVYILGGVLMNYRAGKQGIELLPNLEFWRGIPSLIVDGFKFATCQGPSGATSYKPMSSSSYGSL